MGSRHDLPQEVIAEILVKLPVKSIIRFQTVSKSWFDLVKSSCFIRKHQIESDESFLALCFAAPHREWWDSHFLPTPHSENNRGDNEKYAAVHILPGLNFELSFSYNFFRHLEGDRSWYVAGDCNGILCLTDYKYILLVNPSLKEVKRLPNHILPEVGNPPGYWICTLVGFGFDNTTNDFKVVTVLNCNNWDRVVAQRRVEVYDLRSNAWRELNGIPLPALVGYSCSGFTFFDGVIHWCGSNGILTFNMANNLFHQLECPQGWYDTREKRPSFHLLVLNQESLAFLSYSRSSTSSFVNVWIMDKHGIEVSWTKLCSIGPLTRFEQPLSFWKKDKFIYKETDGKLILYDLLNHSSSVVCDVSQIRLRDARFKVSSELGVCRPSLVSINM